MPRTVPPMPRAPRLFPALILVALALSATSTVTAAEVAPDASEGELVDRALRYVNGEVITLLDVLERVQGMRGRTAAANRDEDMALWRSALEDATTDMLLIQFADERKVEIDRQRVSLNVLEQAKLSGRGQSLSDQARARRRQERREKIGAALSFFDARSANVQPGELLAAYEQRKAEFRRPAQAQVLQIALRPTDEAERAAFVSAQEQVFRRAQDVGEAAAATAASFLAQLVAADPESPARGAILDQAIAAIAALPPDQTERRQREVVAEAMRLVERRATLRTHVETEAELVVLRAKLDGAGAEAFRATARQLSQGPRREDGGDLGMIEAGYLAKAIDDQAFALPTGGMSPVFWSDQSCCLVLVERSEPAAQRSFAEVSGELESLLRQERQNAVRIRAAGILRQRGVIRDLVLLDDLIR